MDIGRLEEFLVLAETCKYDTASDLLYTTNSTLSKHIASMEKELGYTLFDRTSRKVSLSPAGMIFLDSAKQIVDIYHQAQRNMADLAASSEHSLSIAFPDVIRQYGILKEIANFEDNHPMIDVHLIETDGQNMMTLLRAGSCDFAFASRIDFFNREEIESRSLSTDKLVLVMPKNHRFADRGTVNIEDLKNESFAFHNKSYYEYNEFLELCRMAGFSPNVVLSSGNTTNIFDLVERGKAISPLSQMRCRTFYRIESLAVADLNPTVTFTLKIFYMKNRKFTPAMQDFFNYIVANHNLNI